MYKATVRAFMKFSVKKLNEGDASLFLKLAHPDAFIAFPGDNSWSTMFRPTEKSRSQHATHRGIDELRAFANRFADEGVQFEIEDILVNGPPWNTRVALRVSSFTQDNSYNNRAIALLETRWGRLVAWEDYEDTERVAAWDLTKSSTDSSVGSSAG